MRTFRQPRRGFTLIEVMISTAILAIVFAAIAASLIYLYRSNNTLKQDLFALELLSSTVEEVKGLNFNLVGVDPANPADPTSADYPLNNLPINSDLANPENGVNFQVDLSFRGYGDVQSATATSATMVFNQGQDPMDADEFLGHYAMIVGPTSPVATAALGQVRLITGNTDSRVDVTPAWDEIPAPGDRLLIDNGKTLVVTVTWTENSRERREQVRALIGRRG